MPPTPLAPISYASSIIGFISFFFTFLTLLRVFWASLSTLFAAPSEAHDYLDNLRQELFELGEDLRRARRRHHSRRSQGDGEKDLFTTKASRRSVETGALRVLSDSLKHVTRDFHRLERPFLDDADGGGGRADIDPDIHTPWSHYNLRVRYCDMDLGHRIAWLQRRGKVVALAERVNRMQTRRIACEVNNLQA
ncbi:hypothetical protein MMC14_003542 [Varicellaria rhodocarpa]|nr:hypothetical protein [Varicellaria rhodocarpa]